MTALFFHVDEPTATARTASDYLGSPMYTVLAEHRFALGALFLFLATVVALMMRARRGRPSGLLSRYRRLDLGDRVVWWGLTISGVIHSGLVFGHEPGWTTLGYAVLGAAQLTAAWRLLRSQSWRRLAKWALLSSVIGYGIAGLAGWVPDQVGTATKLVEIGTFTMMRRPLTLGKRARTSFAIVGLAVFVAFGSWIGAFNGVDANHHSGGAAQPGVLLPSEPDRAPTAAKIAAAEKLHKETVAGIAKYADIDVAAADGYDVAGIIGMDFHATNKSYQDDGHVLDPTRPENLIYAVGPDGPVLVGVMYEGEEFGVAGPAVGGPLTV